jgi:hypothetical protein
MATSGIPRTTPRRDSRLVANPDIDVSSLTPHPAGQLLNRVAPMPIQRDGDTVYARVQ